MQSSKAYVYLFQIKRSDPSSTWASPYRSAAELFRVGAALGHVDCAYELGFMSAQGRGVKRNSADAAVNLLLVAQVGYRDPARGLSST